MTHNLNPTQRMIILRLALVEANKSLDEAALRTEVAKRGRAFEMAQAMQGLLDQDLVIQNRPALMSAVLATYKLTSQGRKTAAHAKAAEIQEDPVPDLTDAQRTILRVIGPKGTDGLILEKALKAVGFSHTQQHRALSSLLSSEMVEEHSWGMMSQTPSSFRLRARGSRALDHILES